MNNENRNVRLVKVDKDNFEELIDLEPFESQYNFVADNSYSIAEAYANAVSGRYAQPFGVYDGETPVGFVMIGYDIADEEDDYEKYPLIRDNYLIWRFMIDKKFQGKGYGKEAMRLALEFIRTFPCGEAEYCWLSYEPENEVARQLYRSFGFVEAEEMPKGWDEIPAVLKL
ncbi:MAG: GNAT family N-acetyltransferase [Erysipelotrichaceae bacterium]|nr:GNAT family N-acetyltransferase [Erysipelotrichaceae bacterium]